MIENRGWCPKVDIINKLCQRLNLGLNQVLVSHEADYNLYAVEQQLLKHNYKTAKGLLEPFSNSRFDRCSDEAKYFCYLGLVEHYADHNDAEALCHFNLGLSVVNTNWMDPLYRAWSFLGISNIYLTQGQVSKTAFFLRRALTNLKLTNWSLETTHFYVAVLLKVKSIERLQQIHLFRLSNRFAKETIQELRSSSSMYKLNRVYFLMTSNYDHLGSYRLSRKALVQSRALSLACHDYQILRKIKLVKLRLK